MKRRVLSLTLTLAMTLALAPTMAAAQGGVAYARTQTVELDGVPVTFEAYARKDPATGYETNYVKLRDLALALNSTAAQFSVGWDGAVSLTPGQGYVPNGTENQTPWTGDRAYAVFTGETRVNGAAAALDAITLTDDAGGGYTYYKLRDLGEALGFGVDWDAQRGVILTTGVGGQTPDAARTYTSPYTGRTFDIVDGYTSTRYIRKADESAAERAALVLPSFESFVGGELENISLSEKEDTSELFFNSYDSDFEDRAVAYRDLLIEKYGFELAWADGGAGLTGTTKKWGLTYTGGADISKGRCYDDFFDPEPCDVKLRYASVSTGNCLWVEYPKEVAFVYTDEVAPGKTEIPAVIDRETREVTQGGALYAEIRGWSDTAGEYLFLSLPTDSGLTAGSVIDMEALRSGGQVTVFSCEIAGVSYGVAGYADLGGKNAALFQDTRAVVLEQSEEATAVYYYVKLRKSTGTTYEFEGVSATQRRSVSNFTGNGKVVTLSAGDTVYLPESGTTYEVPLGATIFLNSPFSAANYEWYGYYFGAIQEGVVAVETDSSLSPVATVKATAKGETVLRLSLTGSVKQMKLNSLKYGDYQYTMKSYEYQPETHDMYIKLVVK